MNKQSKKIDINPLIASLNKWPSAPVPPVGGYFATQYVKKILIDTKLPRKFDALRDELKLSEITDKLNFAAFEHFAYNNIKNKPTLKEIKKEIKKLAKTSSKFNLILSNLSYPAKYEYLELPRPLEFFKNLEKAVFLLKFQSELALKNKLTEAKGGRPKENRVNFIISIIDIYEEATDRKAAISRDNDGKPIGPFVRFACLCLRYMDKLLKIGDESIVKEIKKALELRPKYQRLNKQS